MAFEIASVSNTLVPYLGVFATVVMSCLALGVTGWILWRNSQFKHRVMIFEKVGQTWFLRHSRAMISGKMAEKKVFLYKNLFASEEIKPASDTDWIPTIKGGRVLMLEKNNNDYKPMRVNATEETLAMMAAQDYDAAQFHMLKGLEVVQKYDKKHWLEKYGQLIAFGLMCVVIIFSLLMLFQQVEKLINMIGGQMAQFAAICSAPTPV